VAAHRDQDRSFCGTAVDALLRVVSALSARNLAPLPAPGIMDHLTAFAGPALELLMRAVNLRCAGSDPGFVPLLAVLQSSSVMWRPAARC